MGHGRDVLDLHPEMRNLHSLAKQDTVCYTASGTLYCKRVRAEGIRGDSFDAVTQRHARYVPACHDCAAALLRLRDGAATGPTRSGSGERGQHLPALEPPATPGLYRGQPRGGACGPPAQVLSPPARV